MRAYRVQWSVDVDAATPGEAARKARALMLQEHITRIGYFRVYESPPIGSNVNLATMAEIDLGDDWEAGEYQDPTV